MSYLGAPISDRLGQVETGKEGLRDILYRADQFADQLENNLEAIEARLFGEGPRAGPVPGSPDVDATVPAVQRGAERLSDRLMRLNNFANNLRDRI